MSESKPTNNATIEVPKTALVALNATGLIVKLTLMLPWIVLREIAKAIIKTDNELTS
jgi:hypothetical protein